MSRANRQAKRHYQRLFRDFEEVFNRHDPMGLIETGAPCDEYHPEIAAILARLRLAGSPAEVRGILFQEFVRQFSLEWAKEESQFEFLALEVWERYQTR